MNLADMPIEFYSAIDPGYSTGWEGLDAHLLGIRMGEMTVLTADTGAGKTTFTLNLAVSVAKHDLRPYICSWEMSFKLLHKKIASIVLRKPMKTREFTDEEREALVWWLKKNPIYVNPATGSSTLSDIEMRIGKACENGCKFVVLDHLDFLVEGVAANLHEEITRVMKILHSIALKQKIHILLVVHPRQTSEEISLHDLRGSSSIKQYADNILVLVREDRLKASNRTKVKVLKNRMFGKEGTCYLSFDRNTDTFKE